MNCLLEIRSAKWKESKPKFLRKQDNDNANGVEVRIPLTTEAIKLIFYRHFRGAHACIAVASL